MNYLNEQDREQLAQELVKLTLFRVKGRMRGLDPQARLDFYRNVQGVNEWVTRYTLPNRGVRVMFVEHKLGETNDPSQRNKANYQVARVTVEPLPENRT